MSQFNLYHAFPSLTGKAYDYAGYYTGPSSYTNTSNVATTGDPVQLPAFQNYIYSAHASASLSGLYLVRFRPSQKLPRASWKAVWVVISTGNEVANAVDLSAETVVVDGIGGVY